MGAGEVDKPSAGAAAAPVLAGLEGDGGSAPTPDPPPTEPELAPPVYTDPIAAGWGRGLTVETASVDQLRALVNGALASARLIPGLAGTPITPSPISLPPPAPQAIDVPQCASALGEYYNRI